MLDAGRLAGTSGVLSEAAGAFVLAVLTTVEPPETDVWVARNVELPELVVKTEKMVEPPMTAVLSTVTCETES